MYPGLSEADCQVATFRYQQMVNEGQRQQISAGGHPAARITRLMSGSVRRQVGALLVHAGHRLQGVQMVTGDRLEPTATGEMRAIS